MLTCCESSVKSIANPNSVYSHTHTCDNISSSDYVIFKCLTFDFTFVMRLVIGLIHTSVY
jgi:hypothetical protein